MSLTTTYNISLDIKLNNYRSIRLYQGDQDSRKLIFKLTDNGAYYPIGSGVKATFVLIKPDKTKIISTCTVEDGKASITLSRQAAVINGVAYGKVILSEAATNAVITSAAFNMVISPTAGYDQTITSSSEFQTLGEMIVSLNAVGDRFLTLEEYINNFIDTAEANEAARASAENSRVSSENTRKSNEDSRKSAESLRVSAENTRVSNENSRKSAETARVSAESTRSSNEDSRKSAETARASAESSRVTAEKARVNAEKARVDAETAREEYIDSIASPNILINSDFKKPINQRGLERYPFNSDAYTIDRWLKSYYSKVEVGSGAIRVTGTANKSAYIQQILEDNLVLSTKYTCTVCLAGTEYPYTFTYNGNTQSFTIADGVGLSVGVTSDGNTYIRIVFDNHPDSFILNWIKLEKGVASTAMPHFDRMAELYKCKRYYQRLEGSWEQVFSTRRDTSKHYVVVPLECSMRTTPTLDRYQAGTTDYDVIIFDSIGEGENAINFSLNDVTEVAIYNNILTLHFPSTEQTTNYPIGATKINTWIFDAEIYDVTPTAISDGE